MLEVAEIVASHQDLQIKTSPIQDLLQSLIESFQARAQEKDLSLHYQPAQEQFLIAMNFSKLRRTIENLLHNAIKFTPAQGQIWMTLEHQKTHLLLSVADTGIGIPPNLQAILFDKFTKAGRPGTKGEPSNGLGMHITREIVKLHGGKIEVISEVSVGSRFIISLPLVANL